MKETQEHVLVLTTCPSEAVAKKIAFSLVEKQLAACVNRITNVSSVYSWQGQIEEDAEQLLMIKTHDTRLIDVETEIKQGHPYELPEIVVVPIKAGSTDYLDWISNQVG